MEGTGENRCLFHFDRMDQKTDSALFLFLFHSFIFLLTCSVGHAINDLSKDEMVSSLIRELLQWQTAISLSLIPAVMKKRIISQNPLP